MANELMLDVDRLPTLTEVLELGTDHSAAVCAVGSAGPGAEPGANPGPDPGTAVPRAGAIDPVGEVLALLEPRIAALLEGRLREALAPALARVADGLIRDAQTELAPALRGLVEEAVAQALRHPRSIR